MCKEIEEWMAEEHHAGEEKGSLKTLLTSVRSLMESLHCDKDKAMDLLKVPLDMRKKITMML